MAYAFLVFNKNYFQREIAEKVHHLLLPGFFSMHESSNVSKRRRHCVEGKILSSMTFGFVLTAFAVCIG